MVQDKGNKSQKVNIRKALMYKREEQKHKYKRLTREALFSDFDRSQELRELEQEAWDKFLFYSKLQEALDNNDRTTHY